MTLATRHDVDVPERPVLVVALEGWIDAGFAAVNAIGAMLDGVPTATFVSFNADELIDQRARRPRLRITDGVRGGLEWPEPRMLVGHDELGSGIAFLVGPEPDYRWRAFSAEVAEIAVEIGARLVVGLGGFPAAVPHTRAVRLASTASNAELAHQVGFLAGTLEVPASVNDTIAAQCDTFGIPSVALSARVPHYVAAMPFPAASLALVVGLEGVSGLVLETTKLRERAEDTGRNIDQLIAQSGDHVEMVRQLETQIDANEQDLLVHDRRVPSGDEIAAELERYLRGESL